MSIYIAAGIVKLSSLRKQRGECPAAKNVVSLARPKSHLTGYEDTKKVVVLCYSRVEYRASNHCSKKKNSLNLRMVVLSHSLSGTLL